MAHPLLFADPKKIARLTGILYLLVIAFGVFAEFFVRSALIVPGDAHATATNIIESQALFRLGVAGDLLVFSIDIVLCIAFYILLKPVNKNLSLLAASFHLVEAGILGINMLSQFAALKILGGDAYLDAFTSEQLEAFSYLALQLHGTGYGLGLIFFGFCLLIMGYLLYISGFVPRILGILLVLAGVVYLSTSFAAILLPGISGKLMPLFLIPFIAELGLAGWLSVKGIRTG
jgi:hypothetical protein